MIRLCEIAGCSVLLPSMMEERALYRVGEISGCAVLMPSFLKAEAAKCVVLMPSALKLHPAKEVAGVIVLLPWKVEPVVLEEPVVDLTGNTVAMLKESSFSLNEYMVAMEETPLSLPACVVPLDTILKETTQIIPTRKIRYPRFLTRHKFARLAEHAVN